MDFHGGGFQYGVFVENWVVCVVESFGDAESLVQLVFGLELCVLVDEIVDAEFAVVCKMKKKLKNEKTEKN